MAGDWIKMRLDLQTHPKVVRILSATKSDKFRVIGGLHAVWSVFDTHSADGRLGGYTPETMDHIIGWSGFSDAMISVGWLGSDGPETLILPEFDEHNGKSGKRRAEDQKRKRDTRKDPADVRNESGQNADKKRTREEKRREDTEEEQERPAQEPDAPLCDDSNQASPDGERRKKRRFTEEDRTCANYLFGRVLAVLPTAKPPNWDAWSDDVRLMREIDKHEHREICELFSWASKDSFWCRNILSPSKLREKWDQLAIQRQQPAAGAVNGNGKPNAYQVAHIDHAATDKAMAEDMARRGSKMPPDGNLDF